MSAEIAVLRANPSLLYGKYVYFCTECVAVREGITLREAERYVKQKRTRKHIERTDRSKYAMNNATQLFGFVQAPATESLNQEQLAALDRKN